MTDDPQILPQDVQAEEHVLGAMLLAPGAVDTCADILTPTDFIRESHGHIYKTMLDLHTKGEPVDVVTVPAALGRDYHVRIAELGALVPASANVHHYARIVKREANRRALIKAGQQIIQEGYGDGNLDRAEQLVYEIATNTTSEDIDTHQAVTRVYKDIIAGRKDMLGIPSGLGDLDNITRGFRPGDLIVVAADTGRGKTALALNAAMHLLRQGRPVAFWSLEMSDAELIRRALSLETGIPHHRLEAGDLTPDEHPLLIEACKVIVNAPLKLRTEGSVTPASVRSELRRWTAKHPETLVIVDYLQLLTPDDKTDNRTVDVSGISRALKTVAMDMRVPIIALSQFHRRINPDERPHRSNLRESGAIENDASVVVLVHRPSSWEEDMQKRGTAELIVAKNRHGKEDVVTVRWQAELMRFSSNIYEAWQAVA